MTIASSCFSAKVWRVVHLFVMWKILPSKQKYVEIVAHEVASGVSYGFSTSFCIIRFIVGSPTFGRRKERSNTEFEIGFNLTVLDVLIEDC